MMTKKWYCKEQPVVQANEDPIQYYKNKETGQVLQYNGFWYMAQDDFGRAYWFNEVDQFYNGESHIVEEAPTLKEDEVRNFLEKMIDTYEGKRSDVADACRDFLEKGKCEGDIYSESRYINAIIPHEFIERNIAIQEDVILGQDGYGGAITGTKVSSMDIEIGYDTLTTLLEYRVNKDKVPWTSADEHDYKND